MTSEDQDFRERFERDKREATAQLLLKCARLVNERAIARVRRETKLNIRTSHTLLFPHIDLEGTRQTELAERLGISKQAVGRLVDELVEMGMLRLAPDPRDGRAKLVHFEREGLTGGLSKLGRVEDELTEMIGARRMRGLREALLALEEALEQK